MNVRAQLSKIALLAALTALALPASALAEYYVPPGNSAANQYTETLPSAGGDSKGKDKGVTPAQALGAKNAHKLEAQGPAGKAAAELAAETAPVIVEPSAGDSDDGGANNGGNSSGKGNDAKGNTGGNAGEPVVTPQTTTATPVSSSSGSSGLSAVLGQATGVSDDGSLGLWLPLIIIATIAGTIAYRLRLRHGPTA
jgi:hypothetical protein